MAEGDAPSGSGDRLKIDPSSLTDIFVVPQWLRDVGLTAWLLLGVAGLTVGLIWPGRTDERDRPASAHGWDRRRRGLAAGGLVTEASGPARAGAALLLLGIIVVGVGMTLMVVGGITGQASAVDGRLADAQDTMTGWLKDVGVDPGKAEEAGEHAASGATASVSALLDGVVGGVSALSSLVFFLAMTVLSLFFLLKDGPVIRTWAERHMGVPMPVAQTITGRVLGALRGYFLGLTIVALFNAAVVAIGAWVLGVPLIGTIVAVTFVGAYIPYIGAWTAGAFAVLVALGGAGTDAAAGMIVVQLIANSVLQQFVQPLAMGTALGIHPLAVLIVTIAGGALFGTLGMILAAPLTSAIVKISGDLNEARAQGAPPPATAPT